MTAARLEHDPISAPTLAHSIRALRGRSDRGLTFLQPDGSGRDLSFAALAEVVEQRAARLLGSGLRPGDQLALIIPDADEFVPSFLAAIRVGIIPIPLYPPLAFGKLDS